MKCAPGPWKIIDSFQIFDDDNESVGLVTFGEKAIDNAKLISAAPDLLEALQGILDIGKRNTENPKYDGYYETAREAIKKATS